MDARQTPEETPANNRQRHAEDNRREPARALEQRVRLLETTLSNIIDFAYILDRAGRFLYVNQSLLDLWDCRSTKL